jgi:hypothetical protein
MLRQVAARAATAATAGERYAEVSPAGHAEVVDPNLLTVATSLPLDQFAAVRNAAPTQVIEYLIDDQ